MIIIQTPLRISFSGGGTDFPDYYKKDREGYVVNAAIDKFVFVIVMRRYDNKIYVNYSRKEIVDHVDEIQHELVREAMKLTGVTDGVEITILADIPSSGTGLGSSGSFTVGLLNAFHIYQGEQVEPGQLAEEACEVEIRRCGRPVGKQDQYIAAFGGLSAFRFRQDDGVEMERLTLTDRELRRLSSNFFLFYSNQTRKADDILSEQKAQIPENLEALNEIRSLAFDTREALQNGDFNRLGTIINRNWELKKTLASGINNDTIDHMHASAMRGGAVGAKVCGAGGGDRKSTRLNSSH